MTMPPPRLSAFLIMVVLISPTVRPSPVFPGFMHSRAGGEPEDRWATTLARSWLRQLAEAQPSQAQENAGDERGINDAWAPTAEDIAAAVSGQGSTRGDALVESLRRELWRLSQQRPKYQDVSWPQGHNGDRISPTGLAWLLRSLESRGRLGSNDEVEEPEEEEELEESYAEYNQPSTWPEDNALPEMGVDSRFEQRRLPWSENDRENLREPGESSVWPGRRPLPPYTAREPTFNRLRPGQVDTGEELDEEALRGLLRYLGQRTGAKASPSARMRSLGESFRSPLRRREAPMSYADPPNSEGFKEKIAAEKSASHNTTQPQDPDGARGPQ